MSQETSKQEVTGIYVSEHQMSNMTMERIVVSNSAILEILKLVKLPIADQEEAVDSLVARTPNWKSLDDAEQIEKIKMVLTMETVSYYLQCIETIRPQVDIIENGVDEEGSIVLYVYYTNMNREQRRQMQQLSEGDKLGMVESMTQMDQLMQQGNIVDIAKKRIEKRSKK